MGIKYTLFSLISNFTWVFKKFIPRTDVVHVAINYSGGLKHFIDIINYGNVLNKYGNWYVVIYKGIPISISKNYGDALNYLNPKLLHIHNVTSSELISPCGYLITLHDYLFICPRVFAFCLWEQCSEPGCNDAYKDSMHNYLLNANRIIAPNESVKSIYLEYYSDLIIEVVPHA